MLAHTGPRISLSRSRIPARWRPAAAVPDVVGYNVQVAVDTAQCHLIVTHEVTNVGTDRSQLAHMAKETKATLEGGEPRCRRRPRLLQQRSADSGMRENEASRSRCPKPMTLETQRRKGALASRTSATWLEEDVGTCLLRRKASPTITRPRKTDWSCARLLDQCRCQSCAMQAQLHHRQGATDHPMGARAHSRGGAAPARRASGEDASAARDSRAPLRHDQGSDGRNRTS